MRETTGRRLSRRQLLAGVGAAGTTGLVGCMSGGSESGTTVDIPSEDEGVEEWGERLNDHAREAGIDWRQFEGTELRFGMGLHPYSTTTEKVIPYFEELTGMTVTYDKFAEDQYWLEAETYLSDRSGRYDGIMVGLWPAGGYHYGSGDGGWVRDLKQYIDKPHLTDKDWLALDDFKEGVDGIELNTFEHLTFPNEAATSVDGLPEGDLVGFPNGIEAYGCLAYDRPTFETLGLEEPTTFAELEETAKRIHESEEVDRGGIVSRTSSETLSSANFGTMFRSHGASWIDRETQTAAFVDDSGTVRPEAEQALQRFGSMIYNYGPAEPGTRDWYANNTTYGQGDVAMMYSTPQTSGIVDRQQMQRTKWLPPMEGPNGRSPVVDTWIWATGISQFSENPEAAWLFIQWANSREANYMLSTKQWQADDPRAGYARMKYVADRDDQPPIPGEGYLQAFTEGMRNVPLDPPPVPVDTPENMNIMSEISQAMSDVASGGPSQVSPASALEGVAPAVTDYAQQIPEGYL